MLDKESTFGLVADGLLFLVYKMVHGEKTALVQIGKGMKWEMVRSNMIKEWHNYVHGPQDM